ncbi:MAG: hypothetical protein ACXVGF_04845 [Blastococcus sp.]
MAPDLQATTYPDLAHERLRQELLDHIEQLADSFLIGQTAADFAQTVLTNFTALQQTVQQQAAEIADLQTRVAALESPTTTTA